MTVKTITDTIASLYILTGKPCDRVVETSIDNYVSIFGVLVSAEDRETIKKEIRENWDNLCYRNTCTS